MKEGLRACLPTGVASGLVAISYGVLARPVLGAVPTVVSSLIIFAGSAQFAMLAVLSAGGGATAAVLAGTLLNLRFVPMGLALAPWVRGGRLRRAATGWIMVDASWAMAAREGGRFDVPFMLGGSLANYPAWVGGTLIGVLAGSTLGNPRSLGLDAPVSRVLPGLAAGGDSGLASSRRGRTGRSPHRLGADAGRAGRDTGIGGGSRRAVGTARPMTDAWAAILGLAATTVVVKAAAPVLLGGRQLPQRVVAVVALFASALLAALVVVETLTDGEAIRPDARLVGLAAAGLVLARRPGAMLPAVVVSAAVTALVRALA